MGAAAAAKPERKKRRGPGRPPGARNHEKFVREVTEGPRIPENVRSKYAGRTDEEAMLARIEAAWGAAPPSRGGAIAEQPCGAARGVGSTLSGD